MKDKLQAFDSIFSDGQIQDIISMSLIAKKSGKVLHEMLNECPPVSKISDQQTKGSIKKLIIKCPVCSKPLKMSAIHKESEKYKSGFRTFLLCGAACCNNKGCGFSEFSRVNLIENGGK